MKASTLLPPQRPAKTPARAASNDELIVIGGHGGGYYGALVTPDSGSRKFTSAALNLPPLPTPKTVPPTCQFHQPSSDGVPRLQAPAASSQRLLPSIPPATTETQNEDGPPPFKRPRLDDDEETTGQAAEIEKVRVPSHLTAIRFHPY